MLKLIIREFSTDHYSEKLQRKLGCANVTFVGMLSGTFSHLIFVLSELTPINHYHWKFIQLIAWVLMFWRLKFHNNDISFARTVKWRSYSTCSRTPVHFFNPFNCKFIQWSEDYWLVIHGMEFLMKRHVRFRFNKRTCRFYVSPFPISIIFPISAFI